MLSKLSPPEIRDLLPLFNSDPKFALFFNAAKFQMENRVPCFPCDFYHQKLKKGSLFYVFRHDKTSENSRPILMIGSDGDVSSDDVISGLEQIRAMEPQIERIEMMIATRDISDTARRFFKDKEDYNNPCYNFYVPNGLKSKKIMEKISLPAGFSIGSIELKDAEVVNSTWQFGSPEMLLVIRENILHLPSVCIYHDSNPISFEMVGLHGQLNSQYTFPKYRNQGLGGIVEKTIIGKCSDQGIQVVKSVEITNELVVKRSSKSGGLWKIVEDQAGNPIIFNYTHYF